MTMPTMKIDGVHVHHLDVYMLGTFLSTLVDGHGKYYLGRDLLWHSELLGRQLAMDVTYYWLDMAATVIDKTW